LGSNFCYRSSAASSVNDEILERVSTVCFILKLVFLVLGY
jgi:hypothetical protein